MGRALILSSIPVGSSITMILLVAGEGRRLLPMTSDKPKALVDIHGKTILDWQLDISLRSGIKTFCLVTGYKSDAFKHENYQHINCTWYHNSEFAETNMVETLWCAEKEFLSAVLEDSGEDRELIVSYGDIIYEDSVIRNLISSEHPVSVVVDLSWAEYWRMRFNEPLSDAESLRLNKDGNITSIGQPIQSVDEVEGQYIGLMKFKGIGIKWLLDTYDRARSDYGDDSGGFRNMYMTDLLQLMIDYGHVVKPVCTERGWVEIDSVSDYELALDCFVATSPELKIK